MAQNATSGYTYYCRGRENFGDHCTHNGPNKAVWTEIILAAFFIFGLFFLHVRITQKQERIRIPWSFSTGDDSEDDIESSNEKQSTQEYRHMPSNTNAKSLNDGTTATTIITHTKAVLEQAQHAKTGSSSNDLKYQAPTHIPLKNGDASSESSQNITDGQKR